MIQTEASIEVRKSSSQVSMSVVMPVWTKCIKSDKSKIEVSKIHIPLLGLKTFAISDEVEDAIKESIECFWIASENFGNGFEKELMNLGWTKDESSLEFDVAEQSVYGEIFETAEQYSEELELELA